MSNLLNITFFFKFMSCSNKLIESKKGIMGTFVRVTSYKLDLLLRSELEGVVGTSNHGQLAEHR